MVPRRDCPSCLTPLPHDAAYCDQCGSATHTQIIGGPTPGHDRVSSTYQTQPGRLQAALGGQLDLGPLLGRGGYAEVYEVRDRRLERDVAIKVLRPDLISTPSLLARFRREALAVAALQHPGIVAVYDVREQDGICFIVMPLIRGESLKALLQRQRRLPIDEVRRIVTEAATALAVAHRAHFVHRDIKPENIMLEEPEGRVRLMDFGIAKAVDSTEIDLTGTGVVVGTPQYMSPEQASGEPSIDPRSDQYSLAVVAYQMLSGRPPFEGETARAVIAKQLLDQPPALATLVDDLPPHVAAALHRAMQKNPEDRFDSITDFAAALHDPGYQNPPALLAREKALATGARSPWPWVGGAILVAGLVAVAMSQWRPAAPIGSALPPADLSPPPPAVAIPVAMTPPAPAPVAAPEPVVRDTVVRTEVATVAAPAPKDSVTTVVPAPPPPPPTCTMLTEQQAWGPALTRCSEAARGGDVSAAKTAARILATGQGGIPVDENAAEEWYRIAAEAGDPESQMWIARRTETSDPTTSTEMYRAAARSGHIPAFVKLGERLEKGLGTARDTIAAAHWYERAATLGDLAMQLKVAALYAEGQWVDRSDSAAKRWYEMAARGNSAEAQYRLAQIYFRGRGVPKSEEEGLRWLQLAAEAGHAEARKELEKRKS